MRVAERAPLEGHIEADWIKAHVVKPKGEVKGTVSIVGGIEILGSGPSDPSSQSEDLNRRIRLGTLQTVNKARVASFFRDTIKPGGLVVAPDSKEFSALGESGLRYFPQTKPRVYRMDRYLTDIRGVFDSVLNWMPDKVKYVKLEEHLDEFVFWHNQGKNPEASFNTLLSTALKDKPGGTRRFP